ncbi:hypothetical protein [Streptomyces auratus]|uniref:Uncharacterized protein n=1 Tax=Streptomyces auratus AGR0001 TaxID=1160718 RepID=A0A8B1NFZ2_9ACTN|nr:hypothetical protein SU9_018295 [Streptomyces auratus AGR0001]
MSALGGLVGAAVGAAATVAFAHAQGRDRGRTALVPGGRAVRASRLHPTVPLSAT